MIIEPEQVAVLNEYNVEISEDVNETLLALDDKIIEIGLNRDYSPNKVGIKLQKLYDQLYNQN